MCNRVVFRTSGDKHYLVTENMVLLISSFAITWVLSYSAKRNCVVIYPIYSDWALFNTFIGSTIAPIETRWSCKPD